MTSALFSSSWYRVADLRPRLRTQAQVVRHTYRGERWHVLQDRASGRFLRLNPAAWQVVALMDGHRSLDQIWQHLLGREADEAPTQDEIVHLLAQLHQANVLLTDRRPDLDELQERSERLRWMKFKQYLANPLSLKFPLLDPDRFFTRIIAALPQGLLTALPWLWCALVGSALVLAGMHWNELTHDLAARAFTSQNVLLMALIFPVLKAVHECGHGLALKWSGGSCHEMGLMFLVMVPVPYVDATPATAFPSKHRRVLVSLAGMMAELSVAAVALWLWVGTGPGLARAAMHEVVVLAGVTTLFFNLNPLIRFDGYYAFADWLEIPNLAQKANQYLGYLVNRHLFQVEEGLHPPHLTPGEARWLLAYAVASFVYRILVAVAIILMVAKSWFFIGVLLAFWAAWTMLAQPLFRHARFLASDAVLEGRRQRALAVTGGALAVALLIFLFVPAPAWTSTEGVIWMPEQSRIRAPQACFGARVLAKPGSQVKAGDALLACTDPEVETAYQRVQARLSEIDSRLAAAVTGERVQLQIAQAERAHALTELDDMEARRADMVIRSPHDGEFAMAAPDDFPGRYVARADTIGYVLDPAQFSLLTVVPQSDVDRVRRTTTRVELRSVDRIGELLPAQIVREVPAATHELPSLALSLAGGGKIGLDPSANPDASNSGPRALAPLFQFELRFSGEQVPRTLGNRVYVRFVHRSETLAEQSYRALRQLFLRHFAV